MNIDLEGRVALVTGGSRGIGRAVCEALAECGATVTVHYNERADAAEEVVAAIREGGGRALAAAADVRDDAAVRRMIEETAEPGGVLDVLVCNAGIWKGTPVADMTEEEWDEMIDINLKGIYLVTRHAVPYLRRSGRGAIVNISSTAGQRGEAFHAHYAASKGGIISWTKSLAVELAPGGVRVNCVAPGWVKTDMAAEALATDGDAITASIPLRRAGRPPEIAAAVAFLASDLGSYITGEIVNVNGGNVLCG